MREGLSVWLYDEAGRFGFPRVCLEATGPEFDPKRLQVNVAFPSGRVLIGEDIGPAGPSLDADGRATIFAGGPLEFRLDAPWSTWTVTYDGTALDTTAAATIARKTGSAPRVPMRFQIDVAVAAPPWVQGLAGAPLRADEIFVGGSAVRYEQLVRANGTLWIADEQARSFTGPGLRIHRQGLRNLAGFEGHVWQSALFPSGRGFGLLWLLPNNFKEAYVFAGERMLPAEVISVSWMTRMLPIGAGEDVSLVLQSELGLHEIRGETAYSRYIPIGDEFETEGYWPVHWQQSGVRFTWDGEDTYGMMERSSSAEVVKT